MRAARLYVEHLPQGPKSIAGSATRVYLRLENEDGSPGEKVDISSLVRAADVRLHNGEVATVNLECFITGLEGRVHLEKLLLKEIKPRRGGWWRRIIDVSTFNAGGWKEYVA